MKNPIPRSALEHHIAFVGKTGSGKTGSAKSGIVEPALAAEERVCVIDPTGAWWGLRLDADGKSKGLPIYVFGGDHGDYPLLATQGEMMAEAIGTSNTPAILDTTKLRTTERMRFFTDFADTILRVNLGPLRLVIDEAHLFAPQAGTRGSGAMPDMLHAANNLISLGRSRGLRIVLISQRPAKVHKDSLTQVESLVAMRLIAPQDRKAVEQWIADQADKETGKEIIASLPKLKTGEAWVWSPEANFLKQVTFPLPRTYDSSKISTGKASKRLSPIDLEKLQAKFAKVKADAEAIDPKALQKKVRELEAEIAKKKAAPAPASPTAAKADLQAAEQRGFEQARKKFGPAAQRVLNKGIAGFAKSLQTRARELVGIIEGDFSALRKTLPGLDTELVFEPITIQSGPPASPRAAAPIRAPATPRSQPARASSPAAGGDDALPGPQQKIVDAIAWWNAMGITGPSINQVAYAARYSRSGTFDNYRSALNKGGFITYDPPGHIVLTEAGTMAARAPASTPSFEALREEVCQLIDGPLAKLLRVAIEAHPKSMSLDEWAEAASYNRSGTFDTYRSKLNKLELIRYVTPGKVQAADWLFAA